MTRVGFTKGHGTGNDFVLVADPDDRLVITQAAVAAVCDRRNGIGGDGLIRIVPSGSTGLWFMDYYNADGSTGEMCGNGTRVFAEYLRIHHLVDSDEFSIGTRGGTRHVRMSASGISVDMGQARHEQAEVMVSSGGHTWPGEAVFMPNPHAVCFVDDLDLPGPLHEPPVVDSAAFPEGVNVEFVVVEEPGRRVSMRVFERGVGETLSCGTGICAVADRVLAAADVSGPADVVVKVPGGTLTVSRTAGDTLELTGPAELVADGEMSEALSGLFHE